MSDIPPDANLRERLAAALSAKGGCEHAGAESCEPWWAADAAIPAVAAWLRDKAAAQLDNASRARSASLASRFVYAADAHRDAADEIDPPKGDETCSPSSIT